MNRLIPVNCDTDYLLSSSVDDWLPHDHLARVMVDGVEQLNLSELTRQYASRGRSRKAHPPSVFLSLLVCGYATRMFSSRKIEHATYDSVAFRYLTGNALPGHIDPNLRRVGQARCGHGLLQPPDRGLVSSRAHACRNRDRGSLCGSDAYQKVIGKAGIVPS